MNILYIFTIQLLITELTGKLGVHFDRFICKGNPLVIDFHRCTIIDPARSLLTAEVKFNRPFEYVNATFALFLPHPPANEYRKILSLNLNLCEFHKSSQQNKFTAIAYKSMMKNTNLPNKCPQPKGDFYFRKMNVGDNLPPFLPNTEFKIEFNFFGTNIWTINVTISGHISEVKRQNGK